MEGINLYLISLMIVVTIERVNICLEINKYQKQSQQHLLYNNHLPSPYEQGSLLSSLLSYSTEL